MNFNDKPAFMKKLGDITIKLDRKLNEEQCQVFFDDLKDLPIEVVKRAMDLALHDRDPDDIYLTRAMPTTPEIRRAAEELIKDKKIKGKLGCEKCEPTKGWILEITKTGRAVAHPCDCMAEVVRAELKRKNRIRVDRMDDRLRESTLVAYEISKLR